MPPRRQRLKLNPRQLAVAGFGLLTVLTLLAVGIFANFSKSTKQTSNPASIPNHLVAPRQESLTRLSHSITHTSFFSQYKTAIIVTISVIILLAIAVTMAVVLSTPKAVVQPEPKKVVVKDDSVLSETPMWGWGIVGVVVFILIVMLIRFRSKGGPPGGGDEVEPEMGKPQKTIPRKILALPRTMTPQPPPPNPPPTGYIRPFVPTLSAAPSNVFFGKLPDDTNAENLEFNDDDAAAHEAIDKAAKNEMADFEAVKNMGGPLNNNLFIVLEELRDLPVDAISNAANEEGLRGGGVDGAVHDCFLDYTLRDHIIMNLPLWKPGKYCPTGSARLLVAPATRAKIKSKDASPATESVLNDKVKVILQAVGPQATDRELKIRQVYWNILEKCKQYGIRHVVIPPISTGIFKGGDTMKTAGWVLDTIKTWMKANGESQLKIVLTIFDQKLRMHYLRLARQHFATPILDNNPVVSA